MKCPECIENGVTSKVYVRIVREVTRDHLPGDYYWDENGVCHSHDPNPRTSHFGCSNGHQWTVATMWECGASECTYGKTVLESAT